MTSFTVGGLRNGSRVQVTWSDGRLTGDPPTVDLIEVEARLAEESRGDPLSRSLYALPGSMDDDALADPSTALILIERALDIVNQVSGDAPPVASPGPASG